MEPVINKYEPDSHAIPQEVSGIMTFEHLANLFERGTIDANVIMSRTSEPAKYVPENARLPVKDLITKHGYVTGITSQTRIEDIPTVDGKPTAIPKYAVWSALPNTPGLLRRFVYGTYKIPKGTSEIWGMYIAPILITAYAFPQEINFNPFGIHLPSFNFFTNVEDLIPVPNDLRMAVIQATSRSDRTVACQAISEWTQQYMIDHPDAKVAFLPLISDRYEGVIPAGAHVRAIKVSWTKAAGIPVPIFQSILTGEFMPI